MEPADRKTSLSISIDVCGTAAGWDVVDRHVAAVGGHISATVRQVVAGSGLVAAVCGQVAASNGLVAGVG